MNIIMWHIFVLTGISIVTVTGKTGQEFGSCYTNEECPGDAFCALWQGCFMGICVCSEEPQEAFGCLWKESGDTCVKGESTNECNGPASECTDGKCSCPIYQSPARHSNFFCDEHTKAGRTCDENSGLNRGESCEEGKVICSSDFREDPHTGVCRNGRPEEPCAKNEECESNVCNSSVCACQEEMTAYTETIRFYVGNGYNVSTVEKCKPVNAPSSAVSAGGACGGYLTCQGSTCTECPEGDVTVCVDLTKVGSVTSEASHFPISKMILAIIVSVYGIHCFS